MAAAKAAKGMSGNPATLRALLLPLGLVGQELAALEEIQVI